MNSQRKQFVAHFVYPYLFRTGSWLYYLIAFQKRYRPFVFTGVSENLELFPFDEIFDLTSFSKARITCERAIKRLLGTYPTHWVRLFSKRPATIHSHFGDGALSQMLISRALGVPHVVSFYGADATKIPKDPCMQGRYRDLFKQAAAVLAEGPYMAQTLQELGCPRDRIHVIHLGVPVADYSFRARNGSEVVRILIASTFTEKKGVVDGLLALQKVKEPFELTLVGDAPASNAGALSYKASVEETLKDCSFPVRRLGYISPDALKAELLRADILLHPSRHAADGDAEGGFPVVLTEMAATGGLIVGTRHCDIPEIAKEGVNATLAREGDADDIAAAIERLLSWSERWSDMSQQARKIVTSDFEASNQARKLESLYDVVLEGAV